MTEEIMFLTRLVEDLRKVVRRCGPILHWAMNGENDIEIINSARLIQASEIIAKLEKQDCVARVEECTIWLKDGR